MISEDQEEKKNRKIAALTTAGIQVVVLLVLFFLVAWRAPDPPLPEYGIELNFGMDTQGSGDVQPEQPVGNDGQEQEQEVKQAEEAAQPEPEVESEPEDIAEVTPEPEQPQVVSKVESPVVVKEKEKKEEPKPIEKPVVEKPAEEKKPEPKKEAPKAVFKPAEPTTSNDGGDKQGKPGNQGDDTGKTGDKGSPEGKLDAKALYGQPGGGGGGVSMSGFNGFDWPKVESPSMPEDAYGVYEFLVKVDDQGDVISVTPVQRGLSLEAERKLKAVIQKLVFVPKGQNLPPQSEGKITFRVVSK